jgi:protein-S-isoprenylcysteine O-methyltransferase Ste14
MSLVPAFEIGVWNAWIFSVFTIIHISLMMAVKKDVSKKMDHGQEEQKKLYIASIFWIMIILYSIFVPFKLGTAWFYMGLALYLAGALILTLFFTGVAATPQGQPFTRGIYRFSRNPMYVGMILQFFGTAIAGASWPLLVLTILETFAMWSVVIIEERTCLERFGDAYFDYMNKTPRWLGLPKTLVKTN